MIGGRRLAHTLLLFFCVMLLLATPLNAQEGEAATKKELLREVEELRREFLQTRSS